MIETYRGIGLDNSMETFSAFGVVAITGSMRDHVRPEDGQAGILRAPAARA